VIFYGWWVALAFALMVFLSTGIRFAVGPFLKPIVSELGLDRGSFSLVVSMSLFLYGAFMPFIGRLVDRFGARGVVTLGTLVMAGALAATAGATRLWHLYVFYGVLLALGLAATGHVVGAAVITRWFTRRRGTALSLLGTFSMAAISLFVPIVMWLILVAGWRTAYLVLAVVTIIVCLPLGLWVVRETPESMGLAPDGGPEASPSSAGRNLIERTPVADAVQTASFWQLAGGLFTCGFSMSLLSAHGVPMLTDHGFHPMVASWALGVLGGSSMLFSMALGVAADRYGKRPVLAWLYGGRVLAFSALFLVRDDVRLLLVAAAFGGATMAGTLAMSSALTGDIFGRFSVGSIFGVIFLVHQTGAALGSWLGGALFELGGGYGAAFTVAAVLLLGAAVVSLTIDERFRVRVPGLAPVAGLGPGRGPGPGVRGGGPTPR
jgi:MFS family permease